MIAKFARIAVVATLLAVAFCDEWARAESPLPGGQADNRVVVLRNGEVIQGKISLEEGLTIVDLPNGQIRLKEADVELVCGNLEDGYRRKRALIEVGNVHQHLALVQWCLRHDLTGFASVELADATVADPKNPMIGVLRHRLKMAMEPPPAASAKALPSSGPSNDELDQMIRGMPRGVVETFTQSVQPVLLNHCTNSGCHGPQCADGLRLHRLPKNSSSSRRVTQRNLYSVLRFIDHRNPSASKLLEAASSPHGTVQYAVFTEHQTSQYQRLENWVSQMGQHTAAASPAALAPEGFFAEPAPGLLTQEAQKAQRLSASDGRAPSRRAAGPAKKVGDAAPASFEQPANEADPFDPEVFNRRFSPGKGKQPEADSGNKE